MNKVLLFIVVYFFNSLLVKGQDNVLPEGVYMWLKEIKAKSSSEDYDLTLLDSELNPHKYPRNIVNDYWFVSEDKSVKKKIIRDKILAIVRSGEIYINCNKFKLQSGYAKVLDKGKYWIFEAAISEQSNLVRGMLLGGGTVSNRNASISFSRSFNNIRHLYLFDIENPQLIKAIPKRMNEIIEDKELFTQYEAEADKKSTEVILKYLKIINKK